MELVFFPTSEGFFDYENKRYIYQYKDHLGNVRLSYTKNPATGLAKVLNGNQYYPFGMNHLNQEGTVYDPLSVPYNYKYNGKELQETGFYDYGWRQYMPDIARWNGMDQLSESYASHSPYAYVKNNPIMFIDPDGRWSEGHQESLNQYMGGYWSQNSSLDPGYASSNFYGMSNIYGNTTMNLGSWNYTAGTSNYQQSSYSWTTDQMYYDSENNEYGGTHDLILHRKSKLALWGEQSRKEENRFLNGILKYFGKHLYMNSDLYFDFGPQLEIKTKVLGIPFGFNIEGKETEKFGFKFNIDNNKVDVGVLISERGEKNLGFGIGIYGIDASWENSGFAIEKNITIGPIGSKFNHQTGERSVEWTVLEGKASVFFGGGGQLTFGWKY